MALKSDLQNKINTCFREAYVIEETGIVSWYRLLKANFWKQRFSIRILLFIY